MSAGAATFYAVATALVYGVWMGLGGAHHEALALALITLIALVVKPLRSSTSAIKEKTEGRYQLNRDKMIEIDKERRRSKMEHEKKRALKESLE